MAPSAKIQAHGLTKRYGALTAVSDLSFSVQHGEVLGFLGPNGAGKTTTMRMFAGFVEPSEGRAEICGHFLDTQPTEAKRLLGYLAEGAPSYGEMTPRDFLDFIAGVRDLRGADKRKHIERVVETLHLERVLDQRIESLSKGYRRRVGLAQAILHDPPVLILDEPTDGLDPNQKHEVRQLIRNMAADKIIVISTHILEEVDAVCNRAIIIAHGRIVADETPEELINRSRYHNAVTIKFDRSVDRDEASAELGKLAGVKEVEPQEGRRSMTVFPDGNTPLLPEIADLASEKGWTLERLHLESGRLDEVFRSITTGGSAT